MPLSLPARPAFIAVDWNGTIVPLFGENPYPGAVETLKAWREQGFFLVVVSCADQKTVVRDVERVGLEVDEIHGVYEKDPTLLELKMRMGPGFYIGDHPADARAAEVAGLPFVQANFEDCSAIAGRDGVISDWLEARILLSFEDAS